MVGFITKWMDKLAHQVDVRVQLVKLNFIERTSNVLSYLIFSFIALFFVIAVLIFLGIGLSEFFVEVTGSRPGGYFITTGIYLLLLIILMAARNSIAKMFSGIFIRILTDDSDDDDDYPSVENKNIPTE